MRATPPRARIDQWQEAQPAPAPARTETAGPPAPSRTAAAPRRTPVLTGRVVHGRSGDAKGHAFRGRVLAIARDDAHQNGNGLRPRYLVDDSGKPAPVWVTSTDIEWPPRPVGPGDPVIGYVVAAPDDAVSRDDCAAIRAAAQRAGWQLLDVVRDRDRGGASLARPGLGYALEQIHAGRARALVVTNLRRLSRSIVDLAKVMRRLRDADAVLIGLDLGFDTSTREGHYAAMVLIEFGVWERERIAERTRIGLEKNKARGGARGRPAVTDRPELQQRIAAMRADKMTLQAIADVLNAEEVPTLRGGAKWRPSSVQAALGYRRPGSRDGRGGANGSGAGSGE